MYTDSLSIASVLSDAKPRCAVALSYLNSVGVVPIPASTPDQFMACSESCFGGLENPV
jgi:hypothetical protein